MREPRVEQSRPLGARGFGRQEQISGSVDSAVNIGAILTITGDNPPQEKRRVQLGFQPGASSSATLLGLPIAYYDVLGESVLERTIDRLRRSGVHHISVISENDAPGTPSFVSSDPATVSTFWPTWDRVVWQYISQGIELLLLVRLGPYVELDVDDLVRFHHQNASALTQVYNTRGLDMVLVDGAGLGSGSGSFRTRLSAMIATRRRYHCTGYINRLTGAGDFRRLVEDALLGRCDIQPRGQEVEPGVWLAAGARVDSAARIEAPAFVGRNSAVCAASVVAGGSSIEQQCRVDCGTTVYGCCILPGTYLGMGLQFSHSLVAGPRLFHLPRNLELQIADSRLIGKRSAPQLLQHRIMKRAASLLHRSQSEGMGLSTRSWQTASLLTTRELGRQD